MVHKLKSTIVTQKTIAMVWGWVGGAKTCDWVTGGEERQHV